MAWITDLELRAAIEGALGCQTGALPESITTKIINWANNNAYKSIRAYMIGRGFTDDQIDDWEMNAEYNERLGVCMAVKRAGLKGEGYDVAAAQEDCKEAIEELKTIPVIVSGEQVFPATGRVGYGDFSTANDRIILSDPDGSGDYSEGEGTTF